MDAAQFTTILLDKKHHDLKKMEHKYHKENIQEYLKLLDISLWQKIDLPDFNGNKLVYLPLDLLSLEKAIKTLAKNDTKKGKYDPLSMEEEVFSSLAIENIPSSKKSIHKIFQGYAPNLPEVDQIYSFKKAIDFIADPSNIITENNIFKLYSLLIKDFLPDYSQLQPGKYYRNDEVFVVGSPMIHQGLNHKLIPEYMTRFIDYVNREEDISPLLKGSIIHFYIAYLHPYFDGNGRMARMLHLWFLVQNGYSHSLSHSFSSYIYQSRTHYYQSFAKIEENHSISKVIDITPFLSYFISYVYNKLEENPNDNSRYAIYEEKLKEGMITLKESQLWNYTCSAFPKEEFSTKQLEKEYAQAAYATIRSFVIKFEGFKLLEKSTYGNRIRYRIK